MIKVSFEFSDNKKTLIMNVKGHSNQNEIGKDIVCSASSILAYTVAQCVTDMNNQKQLKKKPTIKMDSGDCVITCKPNKDKYAEALHLFFIAQVGYNLLSQNYPEYVSLKMFE